MAVLRIVATGDPDEDVLHRPAARVRTFGPDLHRLLDDMLETMRKAPGVGLAAPQVGLGQRITVVEYPDDEENPENTMRVYELINPELIKQKGSEIGQEGCLSIPGIAADVDRSTYVLLKAQDRNGQEYRLKAYDWLARIFQHELDHLQGVLMTDKAEKLYRLVKNKDGEVEAIPLESSPAVRHLPLLRLFPRRWIEAMMEKESLKEVVRTFEPEAAPPGLPEWTSIITPGHSPGHTAFFRRNDRVLIAGDALLTVDAGSIGGVLSWILRPNKLLVCEPPWYTNWDRNQAMVAARAVVRLQPQVLATGHGRPLSGAAAAAALGAYARRPDLVQSSIK